MELMGSFEEKVMKQFEALQSIREKVDGIQGICSRLDELDLKFAEQTLRLDQVQAKVDISMNSLGAIHQEHIQVARTLKETVSCREMGEASHITLPTTSSAAGGTAANRGGPIAAENHHHHQTRPPEATKVQNHHQFHEEHGSRRTWMPKMDFPKFDGEGVRIWLDNCEAYFQLYNIADNMKILSASLNLMGNAAHWYHSVKLTSVCETWTSFCTAVLQEFDVNVHRSCMRDLLVLKQQGTVLEYKSMFHQLVYQIRLYEGTVSETLLVTRFVLGLKEEIRQAVEMQIPTTLYAATEFALVQEALLERNKHQAHRNQKQFVPKQYPTRGDGYQKSQFTAGDVWKARQLKEYRRANNLCYGCGEKYTPGHICQQKQVAQIKAIETEVDGVVLTEALLDAVAEEEAMEEAAAFLTANAVAGTINAKSIKIRALVGNQVMLLLVDSGSSHTFIDQQLVDRLNCHTEQLAEAMRVKVANGQYLDCTHQVKQLEWWTHNTTFQTDMKIVQLGGYDAILGMDWLALWGGGEMTCHWQDLWIRFEKDGKLVTLQGMSEKPLDALQEISIEQIEKCSKGNDIWATVVVSMASTATDAHTPSCIQHVLAEFPDVFSDPQALPPHRAFDHAISLLPDSAPVNS